MDMDSKKMTISNSYKALYGIFAILYIVLGLFITALWNRYSSLDTATAQKQMEVVNNYLMTIEPSDTGVINNLKNALINCNDSSIDDLFISIYNSEGILLYTNASFTRNDNILSFHKIKEQIDTTTTQSNIHTYIGYDAIIQKQNIVTSSFSKQFNKYIISECTVNNKASISGFISKMSFKLLMLLIFAIVATSCLLLIHKQIRNIETLRKYIIQLSEDEDFTKYNQHRISNQNNVNNLTDDLYTMFKTQIDIIKQHDIEREEAIHEEKARLDSKRILANNLNHEIKTPIGIIIGYLDTLINHPDIDLNTRQDFLKKCLQNTQRLQNMVINIAVINRIEDGSNTIAHEDVNIFNTVNHAKDDLKFTLNEYGITFINELKNDIFVRANEMLLYNVFCNLIKNSCFYSGGTEIIFKQKSRKDHFITFSFRDNGKGVPNDAIPKLFDRFYRLEKDKNSKSGTGLGLPIVKESITLCGGKIEVTNHPKGGLEFSFTLPTA